MASTGAGAIDRRTLDERVYEHLSSALMRGVFTPGQVLTLRGISEDLGTSQMPVRNAVSRLSVEHALDVQPNKSIRVPKLNRAQFHEVTDIRLALEPVAASLAAERISAADQAAIATLHHQMEGTDRDTYLVKNAEFHAAIYAQADRPMLAQMIRSCWLRVGPLFRQMMTRRPDPLLDYHRQAVQALAAGDPLAAAAAIRQDIQDAAVSILDMIDA